MNLKYRCLVMLGCFFVFTIQLLRPMEVFGSARGDAKELSKKKREREKKTKPIESGDSSSEEKPESKKFKLAEIATLKDIPQDSTALVKYFNMPERKEILQEIAKELYEKNKNNKTFEDKFNTHTHDAFKVWLGEEKPKTITAKAKQKILKLKKLHLFTEEVSFEKAKEYGEQIVNGENSKFELQLEGEQGIGLDVVGNVGGTIGYQYASKEIIEERKKKKDAIIKDRKPLTYIVIRFNVDKIMQHMITQKSFQKI